eukprot:1591380-Pyramimonas_sp.AAC.1
MESNEMLTFFVARLRCPALRTPHGALGAGLEAHGHRSGRLARAAQNPFPPRPGGVATLGEHAMRMLRPIRKMSCTPRHAALDLESAVVCRLAQHETSEQSVELGPPAT